MPQLLNQALEVISQLSETDQEHIAALILQEVETLRKQQELEKQAGYAQAQAFLQRIAKIRESIPKEEWQKLPSDASKNVDHYLYGSPKED
ncbi:MULTISPECIES: hypothetical protein [unclassified Pseudanabaena]|jgi:hypothetical protein|uniref:hypothetical protein n=1 Tax=unclassified Pseudanabaena TaxID=2593292 RepID=UPI000DB415F2|nr:MULTISPECIES: hypothetical protein [unclassified Pseudanabaena]PZU92967.1 MAG: hypothetical protein DCE90_17325 [Pseudanabaena sp.]TYQ31977.1 hypothetical protein PseudUWO310_00365 [Pseudanabaena sp. UWO310]BBC26329.1 hypothetical protein ABRG53_4072 [Pseudanabaena sp. ABRG5-3]